MAQQIAGLYIDLGLNSEGFNSGLREAGRRLRTFGTDANGQSGKISSAFAAMSSNIRAGIAGATALAGGVAVVGSTAVVSQLRSASAALAEIGAEARKAGVSAEELQELGYAAQQVKVSMDALTDGLKEMQLRADEFVVTGKGSGADAFQRLGYSAEELRKKLKDPVALFKEIIERLKQFDTSAQIRISDEIFGGTGGEQFVRFLAAGSKSIDEWAHRARELGIIMSNELVVKATELDAKFNELATVFDMRLKGAVVAVAAKFDEWATAAQDFLTWVGNWEGWAYFRMAGDVLGTMNDVLNLGVETPTLIDRSQQSQRRPHIDISVPGKVVASKEKEKKTKTSSRRTPGEDFERSIDRIREEIAALELEQQALGQSTYEAARLRMEHDLLAEARRAGVQITPEVEAGIQREAAAYATAVDQLEQARTKMEGVRALQDYTGQALSSSISGLIDGTKSLNDVLKDLVGNLADAAMQAALLGQGPLAGLLGGGSSGGLMSALFSGLGGSGGGSIGLFDTGGYTGAGGRHDPAGVVHRGEYVFDAASTSRIGVGNLEALRRTGLPGFADGGAVGLRAPAIPALKAGGGTSVSLSPSYTIDARGSQMSEAQFKALLDQNNRALLKQVPGVVEQARARMPRGRRS
ncbi:phage tail tape measure protein [Xanthobacter sp. TB0139]|uniref:phage tail tape measure protein n=1 Tax=Xanthobacter sp. TB0139 TaxID=3459178 RepID=UPI00403A6AD7